MNETRAPYSVTPEIPPLNFEGKSATLTLPPFDWRNFLEMELRTTQSRVTMLRKMLGKPKYCPHCHQEIE